MRKEGGKGEIRRCEKENISWKKEKREKFEIEEKGEKERIGEKRK